MQKVFLILSVLLFFFATSNAQHIGYVITTKNDTISCNMVKPVSFAGVQYQVMENDDFIKITEEKIKEYQLTDDSSVYIKKILSDHAETNFIRRETLGKICLYTLYKTNGSNYGILNYYVSKDNDTAYLLKKSTVSISESGLQKSGKEKLISMFSDQPTVAAEFTAEKSHDIETIKLYIWLYNDNAKPGK